MRFRTCVLVVAIALMSFIPTPARADWLLTPYLGATFGQDAPDGDLNYGASLAWMGGGVLGFELDFSSTPDFFGDSTSFGDNNFSSMMVNLVGGVPIGGQGGWGLRPYAVGGIGLMRSQADGVEGFFDEVTQNDFGFNVGAGVSTFFNDNVGVRTDIRYFRALGGNDPADEEFFNIADFDYWRWNAGVTFRF